MSNEGDEVDANFNSQISSLQSRIKELEAENAQLSSLLSRCRCGEVMEKLDKSSVQLSKFASASGESIPAREEISTKKANEKTSGNDTKAINHHLRRYVALKVMYFGQRFYGFASEGQMDLTVESEIFKALKRTRLLIGDRKESQYSRCGRTDKGVSAVGQVIALYLRSKLKDINAINGSGEIISEEHNGEIDYVRVLNGVLPNDIRILGWCPVSRDFSARFSCLSREYKYFFWSYNLNMSTMETAGKKLIGEHNFSNFCKMDAVNVHNYVRHISSFEISPCDMRYNGNQLCAIKIRGSAFLWHQVRCMVAVLFMIGQGYESPDVGIILEATIPAFSYLYSSRLDDPLDTLLDTERTPRKPQYLMAPEIPLVLHTCEFEGLTFTCSTDARQALQKHLEKECRQYQLQAAIFHEALLSGLPLCNDRSSQHEEKVKKKVLHVPLMLRQTEPSYGERRTKIESSKLRAC